MLKDYFEMREWLEQFIPFTYSKSNLGLERINYLLKLLKNPEKKFKSILVGGTSGKGSMAFYLARAMQSSSQFTVHSSRMQKINGNFSVNGQQTTDNLKIGLHVSPHLTYIGERMQINGRLIPVNKLLDLINEVKPKVESMKKTKVGPPNKLGETRPYTGGLPSYFEILVASTFLYFANEKVDIAVVEVGLGGRLDATNVLTPELSIITNVGLDHTDILGNSIEKIAKEKAGIIKQGVPVVTGCPSTHSVRSGSSIPRYNSVSSTSGVALQVIESVAKSKKSEVITESTLKTDDREYYDLLRNIKDQIDLELGKKVYITNECFFLVNLALNQTGIRLSKSQQRQVFSARFAARFEEIDDGILVDGAHNRDKAGALINWVKNRQQKTGNKKHETKIILVCAFKKGKDWKGILRLLLAELDIDRIYTTQFVTPTDTGFFSSIEPEEIKKFLISNFPPLSRLRRASQFQMSNVKCFENSQEAVWEALRTAQGKLLQSEVGKKPLILITGSLYLAGEARALWRLPLF